MARRGENIYKRKDNRYEGRYIKGRKPDGKTIYGSVYGKKYTEVKAKLIPLKAKYAAKRQVTNGFCGTLFDWLAYWLEEVARAKIKPSTYANYYGLIRRHILPVLKGKRLDRLTYEDIQQFVDGLTSKGLCAGSVHGVFRVLNAALKNAVLKHMIITNPCNGVTLPKRAKAGIGAISAKEQQALEQVVIQDKNGAAVLLGLYTGMRIGEICALKWEDVDFTESLIHVRQTVQRIPCVLPDKSKTRILFGTPKSERSLRMIPLSHSMADYLGECKKNADSDYVVSCKDSFAEPRVVEYRFRKLLEQAGIRQVHFHTLRHTFATRCMEMGVDITTLSRLLGHTSVKMTLDIYTDSVMEQRRNAVHMLSRLFPKATAIAV